MNNKNKHDKTSANISPADFRELVTGYQQRVISTCYRFTNNLEDARDVAQEVFLAAYRALPGFRHKSSLATWIYRITVSKSLDFVRRKLRKKRFAVLLSLSLLKEKGKELPAKDKTSPSRSLAEKERRETLRQTISTLPENQQIAILLTKMEGFSNRETAEIMQISVPAVESLIYRGINNLRKKLFKYYKKHY